MFSFMNGLRGVGHGTRSRSETQGEGQRGDNQSLESWQIQGMGDAPRDLSGSRGTTGLGDPGRYSFGKDTGQQGTGPGLGFALPEYGSNLDAGPPSASGAMASGGPGQWARPATGTGISSISFAQPLSASGAMTSCGLGQWARPATGTGISGISFAQPLSALGAMASGGPGQWASPTTGMRISSISFAQPGTGIQGGGQTTASGTTSTGGPVQGASPTTGTGNNVPGVQGPGANAPYGMPPGSVGTGVMPGMAIPPAGMGPGGMGGQGPAGQPSMVGPMSPLGEYSGIGSCLDKLGDALHGPDVLIRPV